MTETLTARSAAPFATSFGAFVLHAFQFASGREHVALLAGDMAPVARPLLRVQSACLTGTAFHAVLCDCRQQLQQALARVAEEGAGCVLYLDQEGRGHGVVEKVAQLGLIARGLDTVEAAAVRRRTADLRDYTEAAEIVRLLLPGKPVRLLTNNPDKVAALQRLGITVAERLPHETAPTTGNREYLRVKRDKMGHLLGELV